MADTRRSSSANSRNTHNNNGSARGTVTARTTTKAKTTAPDRAAVYLRQSLDGALHGAEGEIGLAIARQRKACLKLATDRRLTVVTEYVDNDVSASSRRPRPQFEAMLAAIAKGEISTVVVWAADRLARRPDDLERLVALAETTGLRVLTVNGDLDLSNDQGRLVARILVSVARAESERKGARHVAANAQRAERGLPAVGGGRQLGYSADRMSLEEPAASAVRQAYADVLAGRATSAIARDLNAAGHRTHKDGAWAHGAVRQLLRAPRNAGLKVYRGEIVGAAAWPAIVDEATWRAVNAILDDPARRSNPHSGGTRKHLGTSVYRCGVCASGETMVTWIGATGGNSARRKYMCRNGKHLMRAADQIDAYVAQMIVERVSRGDAADLLVDHERPDLAGLQAEAAGLRTRLEDAAAAFAEGEISRAQLRVATAKLRDRLEAVEASMTHTSRADVLADLVAAKDKRAAWEGYDLDEQRAIVNALCLVTVHKSRSGGNSRLSGTARPIQPGTVTVDFHV